ncbi:hypothetical protein SAMN04488056_1236 [Cohaesibacter marisflavi]|uniref:Uncharacterized protein n=1 Tax=Cohaesibacter marisflavi TaxID=655353 RepID=A0A1I5MRB3_9HYPH|nr:hypothetical protein SAMN04488056_1236 [Cohaesibacter marisflavi]
MKTQTSHTIVIAMQGMIKALTILDTFPGSCRKMPSAYHALHASLEDMVDELSDRQELTH